MFVKKRSVVVIFIDENECQLTHNEELCKPKNCPPKSAPADICPEFTITIEMQSDNETFDYKPQAKKAANLPKKRLIGVIGNGSLKELNELTQNKLRLECAKLKLELEKIPLERYKLELVIRFYRGGA